ncbi:hypothetical protein BDC45DRAFT_501196 [Circinella umbellata]|nr:hypothetical protein BDC45DRAFT_501196 [Circinella umbellata]
MFYRSMYARLSGVIQLGYKFRVDFIICAIIIFCNIWSIRFSSVRGMIQVARFFIQEFAWIRLCTCMRGSLGSYSLFIICATIIFCNIWSIRFSSVRGIIQVARFFIQEFAWIRLRTCMRGSLGSYSL